MKTSNIEILNRLFVCGIGLKATKDTQVFYNNGEYVKCGDLVTVEHIFNIDGVNYYLFENCLTSVSFDYLYKNFIPQII